MSGRSCGTALMVCALAGAAMAAPYDFNGTLVEVDYWADDGSPSPENTAIIIFDWNDTNGPYATEAHAWGYQWSGAGLVLDALNAIDAAGALDVVYGFGGGFVIDGFYSDLLIDSDNHATTGYSGWAWTASSVNGGATWDVNGGGVDVEPLINGGIEMVNFNPGDWTGANATIPIPEPASLILLLTAGTILLRRGRSRI